MVKGLGHLDLTKHHVLGHNSRNHVLIITKFLLDRQMDVNCNSGLILSEWGAKVIDFQILHIVAVNDFSSLLILWPCFFESWLSFLLVCSQAF